MNRIALVFGILLILFSCSSSNTNRKTKFFLTDETVNLYAFVGEKISIVEFDPNEHSERKEIDSITGDTIIHVELIMDNAFKARYKVIENVFNKLESDTIEFNSYDHYGRPQFESFKNVLLYVSLDKKDGNYYQQKYQFDVVEKNKRNEWRGLKGETLQELFMNRKKEVLEARGLFN